MSAEMETAWGHVPALRFSGYTSAEYRRLMYELKHREIPSSTVVDVMPSNGSCVREEIGEWFRVRIQIGSGADTFDLKPEDVVLWFRGYTLHVKPTGEAFAYFPNGMMFNVITREMIS